MNVLVIEDDPSVRTLVRAVLEKHDYEVDFAETASKGEELARDDSFDIIILDLGLPDGNGFDVAKKMRDEGVTTPILVLSAEHETDIKVKCLRTGADDYVTKPFDTEELIARIEAVSRRTTETNGERHLECGELWVDAMERIFKINGEEVDLTNNEFNLLVYLLRHKNQIVSPDEIAENVWDIHFDRQTNYINVYISYLRKKIRKHADETYIDTVRKKGFIISCND